MCRDQQTLRAAASMVDIHPHSSRAEAAPPFMGRGRNLTTSTPISPTAVKQQGISQLHGNLLSVR